MDAERRNPQKLPRLEWPIGQRAADDVSEGLDSWKSLGGSMFDAMISACRNNHVKTHLDAVADRRRYHSDAI